MKKNIFLIFVFLSFISQAADEKTRLSEANQKYMAGSYKEAAELYEQILVSGKESAQVYYNLGNAYFKSGDRIKAILNYERAKLLAPRNQDIDFNLRIANQYVVDNIEQLPKPFYSRWWSSLAGLHSADGWAWTSVTLFLLFLVLLGTYFFSRNLGLRKLAFYAAVFAGIVVLISFSLAGTQYRMIRYRHSALVQCARVTVKSSPSVTGIDLFLIHEGLKVQITDELDKWREIELADGNKGWVADSCLVKI